ncbi:peptide chain release factor N(5)-glutamine methyltransferase [Candidatus Halobeggiatoa sp. HSG11]|nr:peptide chain release factor N(5)-glutamine methyltransferase [Candidatus Halobeggiatoa sp. HSG11]
MSPSLSIIINSAVKQLSNSDTPRLDIEILLCHVLKKNRSYLYTWPQNQLTDSQYIQFQNLLTQRVKGEPIAYLIGHKEFWSLDLQVTRNTLIPRPETELLVEQALIRLPSNSPSEIIDLGTGTGAIALAIAKERPQSQIIAIDKFPQTLQVAQNNAQRLKLYNIEFVVSDWLANNLKTVNLIISNPPYINLADPHLTQGDVQYEPRSSLVAGMDGLKDIKQIIAQSYKYLLNQGWLLLEHGYNQAEQVRHLLTKSNYQTITTYNDLAGQPRVTGGQKCINFGMRI